MAIPLDSASKRILVAWISSDIIWALAFIRARMRHEVRAGVRPK